MKSSDRSPSNYLIRVLSRSHCRVRVAYLPALEIKMILPHCSRWHFCVLRCRAIIKLLSWDVCVRVLVHLSCPITRARAVTRTAQWFSISKTLLLNRSHTHTHKRMLATKELEMNRSFELYSKLRSNYDKWRNKSGFKYILIGFPSTVASIVNHF